MKQEADGTFVVRVSGTWKASEFGAAQDKIGEKIEAGARPRLLVILENFGGWERGADWNDLDFLFTHSDRIARIAIVGETRWEAHALAFAGAGLRRAPVRFFQPNELETARAWLAG